MLDLTSFECGVVFFFFQAEDGIRDTSVTGVQTCALPILRRSPKARRSGNFYRSAVLSEIFSAEALSVMDPDDPLVNLREVYRSEERRVGKEWRSRWSPDA